MAYTENLRREQPMVWWGTLLGPVGLTILALALAWGVRGWEFMVNLVVAAFGIFFGLGRAVLLVGNEGEKQVEGWQRFFLTMTTAELFVLIVWMDTLVGFIMVFHASYLYRIPKVGPGMLALQEDGRFILAQHPWLRRFAWVGLVIFVLLPFAATGSLGGSIFGRILGLSRLATITGVILGSILSTTGVFFFAKSIKAIPMFSGNSPWGIVAGIAFIVVLAAFINWRYQQVKRRWAQQNNQA